MGRLTFDGGKKKFGEGSTGGNFLQMEGDDQIFVTYCSETYSSEPTNFT